MSVKVAKERKAQLPVFSVRANISPQSVDLEKRTIDLCWSVGAKGLRSPYFGEPYYEELSMDPSSIRLGRLQSGSAPLLDSHDQYSGCDAVIGVVESARIENGQGIATVRFADTPDVANTWEKVRSGIIKNVSVGYSVYKYDRQPLAEGEDVPTYLATDWEPYEISMVPVGFDENAVTRSTERKTDCVLINNLAQESKEGAIDMDEEQKKKLEQEQRAAAEKADAEKKLAAEKAVADQARAAEKARSAEIHAIVAKVGLPVEIAQRAVSDDKSVAQVREMVIEELANKQTEVRNVTSATGGKPALMATRTMALENALLHRANPGKLALSDDGRFFRGMGLLEMARNMLEGGGINTFGMSKNDLATRAFHSTSDFSNVLANVANKSLRKAYDESPRTFTAWAKEAQLPDFKQVSRTVMGNAPTLDLVKEDGEIQRGTIGDGKEVYSLATYAKIFAITRNVLINDDLGAFTNIPAKFGMSAASLESDVVYAILTANAALSDNVALFHASHGNLANAAVPSITTLGELRKLMRLQKGLDGARVLNLLGKFGIFPAALEVAALQLIAQTTPAQASQVQAPISFTPIIEPRLDAASATQYYLACDPNACDTIEYGYLEGQQGVYSESRVGFDVDGLEIKARLDFAAKALDHRGLARNG